MFEEYFLSLKKRYFIFLSFIIPLFYTLILSALVFIFFKDEIDTSNRLQNLGLFKRLIYGILLAPLIETLLFQFLPIELYKLFVKQKEFLIVIISGGLFGIVHYYNNYDYLFAISAFFVGLVFAYIYLLAKKRKDITSPFLLVFIIHAAINLCSITINTFF